MKQSWVLDNKTNTETPKQEEEEKKSISWKPMGPVNVCKST